MNIDWGTFTGPDETTYREIKVSDAPDWDLFDHLADVLRLELAGRWTASLDGPDQRYWDLEARSGKITFHLDHYMGMTLYPTDGAQAGPASLQLLEQTYQVLAKHDPR